MSLNTLLNCQIQYPAITREEEIALFLRWRDHGDARAKDTLINSNLRLAAKVALQGYRPRSGHDEDDLVQQGLMGMLTALRKFDPDRGYRFMTYAVHWIRAYTRSYILNTHRIVRVGTTQAERRIFSSLSAAQKAVTREEARSGRVWTEAQRKECLAAQLRVTPKILDLTLARIGHAEISLDVSSEEGSARHETIAAEGESFEDILAEKDWREDHLLTLQRVLESLPPREAEILKLRYLGEDGVTLKEIGQKFGLSRERIRQIEANAIR